MDLNKAMIIGRLTQDPEVRTTPNGQSVASFSVATNFCWNDQSGQRQEKVEYHNMVAWRKLAEIIGQYLRKGSKVYIEGRLQTRSWEDQNGVKKYRTEIVTDNMIMLDRAGAAPSLGTPAPAAAPVPATTTDSQVQPAAQDKASDDEIKVEDIPF